MMRRSLWSGGFLLVFLLALGVARLIPAFQSPDEVAHLFRADMIAHGELLLEEHPATGARVGGFADVQLIRFGGSMIKIAGANKDELSPGGLMDRASEYGWVDRTEYIDVVGTAYYLPVIYLPHAAGLAISRHLDWSMRRSYEFTRAIVLATVLGLLAWAWTLLPPNLLVRALVLMPMSVFQILSPTIDGLCMAMSLVLGGLAIAEYRDPDKGLRWRIVLIYALTFILATSRTNLLPLLAIALLLLYRRFSVPHLLAFALLCGACLAWTLFVLLTTTETRLVRSHTTLQIVIIYLADPLGFLDLVRRTILDDDKGFLLGYSFVGVLGWLDTYIPWPARNAIWIVLLAGLVWGVAFSRRDRKDDPLRAVFLLSAIGSALLAFFALAVTWNDYPVAVIAGLQGRYFIIPALLFALSAGPLIGERSVLQQRAEHMATAGIVGYFLFVLVTTLAARYEMGWL